MTSVQAPRRGLRLTHAASLFVIALATISCSGGKDGTSNSGAIRSTSSTVGDTLVVRTVGAVPDAGTHTLTELWRVGDADGTDSTISFGSIGAFALKADGTVAVFDYTGPTVRTYDINGRYLRTVGRKGAGPGEYSRINGMAYLADGRLALWDPPTARITLYNNDASVASEWRPPTTSATWSNALNFVSTHALAVKASFREDSSNELAPPRTLGRSAYYLYDSTGTVTDTLLVLKSPEEPKFISAERDGMSINYGVPFSPFARDALRPDGQLVVAFGRDYAVVLSNGDRLMRIEREAAVVPTSEGERSDARATAAYQIQQSLPEWRWDGTSIPDVKPAIRSLVAASDNRLWVQVWAPGERIPESEREAQVAPTAEGGRPPRPVKTWREPMWYDVYEPSGEFFARIVMPPGSRLLGARGDLAWGVVTDQDDVPFLVQWRIAPAAKAP